MPIPLWAAILPLVIAFVTTYALVPQVRRFAIECRVADKPNGRKLHADAIPHLGGVAIFSGYFFGLLVALASPGGAALAGRLLALLPALVILFGLGLVDDLRGLRAKTKLTYQVLGASCAVAMGAGFAPAVPGDGALFAVLAVTSVLWYVGICNSINLIDGLDGLASGVVALAALGFLVVGVRVADAAVITAALCTVGAVAAFLRFNFHPARIFMGDTGAMFLGFGLAALGCLLGREVGFWTAVFGSTTLLGVPVMDTAAAIVRRLSARRHIFEADGEHTHHRLLRAGLSHRGAVLVLYAVQAVFTLLGIATFAGFQAGFPIAVALAVVAAVTISSRARRALPQPVRVPVASVRALPQVRDAVPAPARLRAAGIAAVRREELSAEALRDLPPAAARPS
jgi:UDP-GlcNAc:undecaprenyl-phosphate GlcNAc-1-phosphate transferase